MDELELEPLFEKAKVAIDDIDELLDMNDEVDNTVSSILEGVLDDLDSCWRSLKSGKLEI